MSNLPKSAKETLQRLIDQIERLETEKAGIGEDIRDKFLEAKASGFDPQIMKQVLRLRKKPKAERDEEEAVLGAYLSALGMLADTPLGEYAVKVHKIARSHGIPADVADQVVADA